MERRRLKSVLCILALVGLALSCTAFSQKKVLQVGMTLSDIPTTTGQPDGGFEGYRFTGYTMYDALINWKLDDAKAPSTLVPGLATDWKIDDKDKTKWIFGLRKGVKFHDGSDFNADAVIWNLDKLFKKDAPQHDPRQAAQVRGRILSLKFWRKVDDYTVELITTAPDSSFPYQVTYVFYSSPTQWEKVGRDWAKFARQPSGTGPFRLEVLKPRERAELVRNPNYWEPKRVAKSERLILLPIPEATTRASALLSGQVDFIEAPPPDFIPRLKAQGCNGFRCRLRHRPTRHEYTCRVCQVYQGSRCMRSASRHFISFSISTALLTVSVATGMQAQQIYPARPVRLIVPSSPGGGTDLQRFLTLYARSPKVFT